MFDMRYMQLAFEQANLAFEQDEVPVGVVIVDTVSGDVVFKSHNLMRTKKDPTAHAELLAIQEATQMLGKERLNDYDIYVSLEPCTMCAAAISYARFANLYFGAYDTKSGGVEHGAKFFEQKTCHHQPHYIGGIMAQENRALIQKFFQSKRGS